MLDIENLTVNYGDKTVLENFSLSIKENEIIAIVGQSGSGKTTALRAILGMLSAGGEVSNGKITFEDKDLLNMSGKQWQSIRGKEISMIFQDTGCMLNPIRTIGSQFVEYIMAHSNMSKCNARDLSIKMLKKQICKMHQVFLNVIHFN